MNAADTVGVSPAPPSPLLYKQEHPEGEQVAKKSFLIFRTREGLSFRAPLLSKPPKRRPPLGLRKPIEKELNEQKVLNSRALWYLTDEWKEGMAPEARAKLDLSPEDRQQYQEFHQQEQKKLIHFLRWSTNVPHLGKTFFSILSLRGPRILAADPFNPGQLLLDLERLWLDARKTEKIDLRAQAARKLLRTIGEAFAFVGEGGRPELPPEKGEANKRKSNLDSQHDRRAVDYYDKAWNRYQAEKKDLQKKGIIDIPTLEHVASNIAREEFSRKSVPKTYAKQLFEQQVKKDLGT